MNYQPSSELQRVAEEREKNSRRRQVYEDRKEGEGMKEYDVWKNGLDENEADAIEVRAWTEEQAAEIWAAISDGDFPGEHAIIRGDDVEALVRDVKTGKVTRWQVIGRMVPEYAAIEIASAD